nr:TonB-dependent receptor [Sphingomonas laterariae]
MQETPVAVSALSQATLERLNIQDIGRVAQLTPNVTLTEGSGTVAGVSAFIRGIGNQDPLLSLDTPIGIYLDGVYNGRVGAAGNFDLVDLERVEVLRGPQGTLFGRNTTGGAISLITRQPLDETRIQAKGGYGSYDEWYGRISMDTGLLGDSGVKANFVYLHRQRDGVVDNINAPDRLDPGALNVDALYGKLAGDWGDLRAMVTFDYNDRRGVPLAFQIAAVTDMGGEYYAQSPGLGGDALSVVGDRRLKTINQETTPGQVSKVWGTAMTLEYDVSDAVTLKSITSYRKFRSSQPTRYAEPNLLGPVVTDFTTFAFETQRVTPFSAPQNVSQHQVSEEFQILGRTDRLQYVAGLYYFQEKYAELNPNFFTVLLGDFDGPGGLPPLGLNQNPILDYNGKATSYAAFGQATYTPPILDERLDVTLGIRQTKDKKSIDVRNFAFPGATPTLTSKSDTFNNTSYNATIDYKWTDDVMTYARIGTGYRSGGFNARGGAQTFRPEKATTYEVGLKSEFFDRRLRVNAAGFYTRYRDLQVAQFSGGMGFAENANANYPGFEIEVTAAPIEGLTLDASIGYVDPEYTSFPQPNPDPNGPAVIDIADIAKFPYVPKTTTHWGAEYALPAFDWGQLSFRVDYATSSKRWFHASNLPNLNPLNDFIVDPGQKNLSARITLADVAIGGGTAEISGWADNLTNHDNVTAGIDFGPFLGIAGRNYGMPRRFGVDLKFTY